MAVKLQIRRGTSTQWAASTEVLASGEIVWDTTNLKFKVGNGVNTWSGLPYTGSGPVITEAPTLANPNTFTAANTFNGGITANLTSSIKGLVIKAPSSGTGANAFELLDQNGLAKLAIDYTGVIKSAYPDRVALIVADSGVGSPQAITITGASYASNKITFTTTGSVGLSNGASVTLTGLPNDFAFLNNNSYTMIYTSGSSFSIDYTPQAAATVTAVSNLDGTNSVYSSINTFVVGQRVTITGLSDTDYNITAVTTSAISSFFIIPVATTHIGITGQNGLATPVFITVTGITGAIGTASSQSADIQRWQTINSPNAAGVNSSGSIYSGFFYTKGVDSLTSTGGRLGYISSTADLDVSAIGAWDIARRNQFFGNTTIGYGSGGTLVATQYGALQVYKSVPGASTTNAALAVRGGSGTGWLQSWMLATTSVAELDYLGGLRLSGSLNLTGGVTSGGNAVFTGAGTAVRTVTVGSGSGVALKRHWNSGGPITYALSAGGIGTIVLTTGQLTTGATPAVILTAKHATDHIVLTIISVTMGTTPNTDKVTTTFRAYNLTTGAAITSANVDVYWSITES